jgi:flavin reductase (DIM6/NTAB) family NADH-FMN oxidoreductase RutF
MHLHQAEIENLEKRYRTTFINSLAGFRQAVLVGTKSKSCQTNLAIFNSLIHLGANPALFGLISRPDVVQRDTYKNILDTKSYTLNFVHYSDFEKAHQTSARYENGISEFDQVGFTEAYIDDCYAPFVSNAIVKIEMKLEETIPIPLNGTILIIGSIQQIEIHNKFVEQDGFVDLSQAEVLISQGLDAYFVSKDIGRLGYAKP